MSSTWDEEILISLMRSSQCQTNLEKAKVIISNLVNNGFDLNTIDNENGCCLLFNALVSCNLPIMKMLLEAGADPCIVDLENGFSLLHLMATLTSDKYAETGQHLLDIYEKMDATKKSEFVNAPDICFVTPLGRATFANNKRVIGWLLQNSANATQLWRHL
ncbi:MAG: hypothetical protein WCA48_17840 [Pseudomonas gingeri]